MAEDVALALPSIRSTFGYRRQGHFRTPTPRQGTHGVLSKLQKSGAFSSRLELERSDYQIVPPLPPIAARGVAVNEELNAYDLGRLADDDRKSPRLVHDDDDERVAVHGERTYLSEQPSEQLFSRKQQKLCDITSAQQALRKAGHKPGDWDAKQYCRLRRAFGDEGRLDAIPALTAIAAQASRVALDAGEYRVPSSAVTVQIPKRDHVQWLGLENLPTSPEPVQQSKIPPLVCSSMKTIDAAVKMQQLFPQHLVCASFDGTDFSTDGRSLLGAIDARSSAQQEMFIRTNLEYCSHRATTFCGRTTVKEELTAKHDPNIFVANDVVIFRGPAEDGYPFLDAPLSTISLLVTGRAAARPHMSKKGEYFALQEDMASYIDRLNLIAFGATLRGCQDNCVEVVDPFVNEDYLSNDRKPLLVIGLQDLTATASQQPRHSIATAIKGWRLQYGHLFHAVLLACGDASTAVIMDKTVNGPLYAHALGGRLPATEWHWNMAFLQLSINGVSMNVGERVRTLQLLKKRHTIFHAHDVGLMKEPTRRSTDDDECDSQAAQGQSHRRRSNVTMCMGAEAVMDENNKRASLAGEYNNGLPPVWKVAATTIQAETKAAPVEEKRRGSVGRALPENADSRTAFQVCLAHRLGDTHVHDFEGNRSHLEKKEFYQCPKTEEEAHAGEARAHAVSAFLGVGKHLTKHGHKKKQEKRDRERSREVAKKARSLNMPAEIQAALHVEKRVGGGMEDSDSRERDMMEQLQSLAMNVDRSLQIRQPAIHVLE